MAPRTIHTHYDNLKVARNAPPELIRAAYKVLAQKYHPDKWNGSEDANRVMKLINESYAVLMNPQLRAEHDNWISEQEDSGTQQKKSSQEDYANTEPKNDAQAPDEKKEQPSPKKRVFSIDSSFWWSLFVCAILARLTGALGAVVAFVVFSLLSERIGKTGAAVMAMILSVASSSIVSQYLSSSVASASSPATSEPIASATADSQQQATQKPLTPTQNGSTQKQSKERVELSVDAHFELIRKAHPDFDSIVTSPVFLNWLDVGGGKHWQEVSRSGGATQVISMLDAYKQDMKNVAEAEAVARASAMAKEKKYEEISQRQEEERTRQLQIEVAKSVDRALERFPYLRQPEYRHVLDRIIERRDQLISQGVHPSLAITRAVNDFAYAYDPSGERLPRIEGQSNK